MTEAQIRAERDYLAARFLSPDGWGCRDTGLSSNALICWAMGLCEWEDVRYPADRADYGRCVRATEAAPEHLRERMREGLTRFDANLVAEGR